MTAIFTHELRSYFHTLTAWLIAAFLLCFTGIGAMMYNIQAAVSNFEYVLSLRLPHLRRDSAPAHLARHSRARRQKTDQLLYSLPVSTVEVVLGKYAALIALCLAPLAIIAVYQLIFAQFGDVYLPTSYGSLFAFFLLGAALLAVGMFVSSLTENQGLAAGVGIALILFNYYSVSLSEYVSTSALGSVIAPRRPRLPRGAAAQAPDGQRLARLLGRPRPRDAQRRALHPRAGVDRGPRARDYVGALAL